MTHPIQSFVIADPRTFDGNPYEVAERAVAQLQGLLALADQAVGPALLMVRNAELERQLAAHEPPSVQVFDESLQGKRWAELRSQVQEAQKQLALLRRVAAFNPKAPQR